MAAKEVAAKHPSTVIILSPSEAPLAKKEVAAEPPSVKPSTKQPDTLDSGSVVNSPMCASPPVSPLAAQSTARPLHITKVQINPILLTLSTAFAFDLELSIEANNEVATFSSQILDNLIGGIPIAHSPTGDAPEVNQSTPSTSTSSW